MKIQNQNLDYTTLMLYVLFLVSTVLFPLGCLFVYVDVETVVVKLYLNWNASSSLTNWIIVFARNYCFSLFFFLYFYYLVNNVAVNGFWIILYTEWWTHRFRINLHVDKIRLFWIHCFYIIKRSLTKMFHFHM